MEDNFKAFIKPQYVGQIAQVLEGKVGDILKAKNERKKFDEIVSELGLENLLEREIDHISGGELQRFAIALVCLRNGNAYLFDEPTSYLDIKQRLKAAKVIRSLIDEDEK